MSLPLWTAFEVPGKGKRILGGVGAVEGGGAAVRGEVVGERGRL